jgi:ABC-2 type transport system permease protein
MARTSLTRLVAAEFRKLLTTRLWLWLLLTAMALTALYVSLSIGFGDDPENPTASFATAEGQRTVLALAASGAGPLLAVLAAISLTGEFRHRTVTATFLATPHRGRVVGAKLITYALVGVGYAVACIAVAVAITVPWLNAKGYEVPLTGNGIPATLGGIVAAVGLWGLVGVGLAALIREQVATVVGLLIYLYVAEPIVTRIPALDSWTPYLPGEAENSLTHVDYSGSSSLFGTANVLEPWQGGLLFAAYGLALALAGTLWSVRRDVA